MSERSRQLTWAKLRVGAVITAAVLLIFLTILFAGGIETLFVPKVKIKARIPDVKGLRTGAPVWIAGIEVGSVKSMSLDPATGTIVVMSINKDSLKFVRADSKATVMTMGLLGDKYIELGGGSSSSRQIRPGDIVAGSAQIDMTDLMAASSESIGKITMLAERVGSFIEQIEKGEGLASKLLKDPAVYNNLKETTASMAALLKDFQQSKGTIKMLIDDPSLYRGMLSATESVDRFGATLNQGSGSLRKLAEDPALYNNLEKASRQLTIVLADIEGGKGTAGALIKDEQLAGELKKTIGGLKDTIEELKGLTQDIRNNPKKFFKFSLF